MTAQIGEDGKGMVLGGQRICLRWHKEDSGFEAKNLIIYAATCHRSQSPMENKINKAQSW